MKSAAYTVGTTAVKIIVADDTHRTCYVHVVGNSVVYVGNSTVTTSTGLPTEKSQPFEVVVPSRQELYAIVATATEDVRVLTPDTD